MIRVLFFLQTAFSLWMEYDAIRHRRDPYWFFVIMMPFGELAYFFMVKIHDPELRWLKQALSFSFHRRPKVETLEYAFRQTPCFANQLGLAQGLHDAGHYERARELFAQALSTDAESVPVLYGLGATLNQLGEYRQASKHLRKLVELEPGHANYDGWIQLAYAHWHNGDRQQSLETLDQLIWRSPRIGHRLTAATFLSEDGQHDKAREHLLTALEDFRHAPPYQRRVSRPWARQAKKLLKQLEMAR